MSMVKTKREKVKNDQYIVTDYIYENDNVGINLRSLYEAKTGKNMTIPCIPISYNQNPFTGTTSSIKITANIGLDAKDNVNAVFNIAYPDKSDTQYVKFTDDQFATDMINACILDKKDIKEIACYKNAFEDIINKIKVEALSNDILIKTPEIQAKCYIYTEDLVLLGTANRLLESTAGKYVLGEYCGKNLHDYMDEYGDALKIVIDVCINKDITLQLTNVELLSEAGTTFGYVTIDMNSARVVRIDNIHESISYETIPDMVLPEYKPGLNESTYYERYLIGNSPNNIEKFYKLNKVSTNPTININKYLIW